MFTTDIKCLIVMSSNWIADIFMALDESRKLDDEKFRLILSKYLFYTT